MCIAFDIHIFLSQKFVSIDLQCIVREYRKIMRLLSTLLPQIFILYSFTYNKHITASEHDYCIVGAGPAGLQLSYFLHQAKRDFVVFERNNISGTLNYNFGALFDMNVQVTTLPNFPPENQNFFHRAFWNGK